MRTGGQLVIVRVSESTLAALPLESVLETMRPLACQPFDTSHPPASEPNSATGAGGRTLPPFVVGAAVVRGEPTVVIDLRVLLGLPDEGRKPRRWVTVGLGGPEGGPGAARVVAIAVDDVIGVHPRDGIELRGAPLLASAVRSAISSLAALDRELLVVLETGRMIDEETFRRLERSLPHRAEPGVRDAG